MSGTTRNRRALHIRNTVHIHDRSDTHNTGRGSEQCHEMGAAEMGMNNRSLTESAMMVLMRSHLCSLETCFVDPVVEEGDGTMSDVSVGGRRKHGN